MTVFPYGNSTKSVPSKAEVFELEILATYDAISPRVERLANADIRVVMHFGHTSVDIIDHCREQLSVEDLAELIDLWANPDCKREYQDLPEGLLVRRIV
jgi:adenylosuccinate lyase